MLKFSVQTFYQPLFSHTFPFSNFPLAILFPSVILFPSKSFPTPKSPKQKNQAKAQKTLQSKSQRQKAKPQALLQGPFINISKQGGAEALGRVVTL
jgi:hypothetical protein